MLRDKFLDHFLKDVVPEDYRVKLIGSKKTFPTILKLPENWNNHEYFIPTPLPLGVFEIEDLESE